MIVETKDFDGGVHIPPSVAEMVRNLVIGGAISVWLIGSRANNCASDGSDWDLLVFQAHDPISTAKNEPGIDVLRVGPSGEMLLDGRPEYCAIAFSDFEWVQNGQRSARYRGKQFIDYPEEQSISSDAPRFHRPFLIAQRLWP